ncbi:hypothetical protein [Cytobacillus purgationiresistens]|uniref:Immunity protein 50 of polymorphic toxin system n=1 Tax=Cytobacillus purgationiresistens TaxID=863449 RepID=A0ABU0AJ92_9BACI|nr:hypothetical protein [Cytobacillus purgationiresistens]MDQ0271332.1 hypothetical protein [Cytobacillus purgationiresistens]
MKEWYKGTELEKKIPNFKLTNVKYITDFHYYIGYNSYYDQVSFLEIDFLLEVDTRKITLKMKFSDVSSLDLLGFGNNYNQLMGFRIIDLSNNGFEKNKKYLVEDYENNIIKFYCAGLEVLSLD